MSSEDDKTERIESIKGELEFLKSKNFPCHVEFNNLFGGTTFYNGLIASILDKGFSINDRRRGQSFVSFSSVIELGKFGGTL